MTLAGTRPPTLDEWEKYELHHRARLATFNRFTNSPVANYKGELYAFDESKSAWANEYQELKGLLSEEEYASASVWDYVKRVCLWFRTI